MVPRYIVLIPHNCHALLTLPLFLQLIGLKSLKDDDGELITDLKDKLMKEYIMALFDDDREKQIQKGPQEQTVPVMIMREFK